MDKTQRVVMVLLILVILFSVISIFVSLNVLEFVVPQEGVSEGVFSSGDFGGVDLVVESRPSSGGGG